MLKLPIQNENEFDIQFSLSIKGISVAKGVSGLCAGNNKPNTALTMRESEAVNVGCSEGCYCWEDAALSLLQVFLFKLCGSKWKDLHFEGLRRKAFSCFVPNCIFQIVCQNINVPF